MSQQTPARAANGQLVDPDADVYVTSGKNNNRHIHYDPMCYHLASASNIRGMDTEATHDDWDECRNCTGSERRKTERNWGYQDALKRLSASNE